jgi:Periplasmic lysozyme inhibitor of I-type lysozyme
MTKVALAVFLLVLSATFLFAAQADRRYVQLLRFPGTGETVVIAEGDLEPRSIGSYTMRVYKARSAEFPTDEFITGVVRPRNGTIDAVRSADVDGDNRGRSYRDDALGRFWRISDRRRVSVSRQLA